MDIYIYNGREKPNTGECVLSLGFFDGVHIAHRDLIRRAKECADVRGIPLGVFTFPSESEIKSEAKRIYTTEKRLEILESLGVDFTVLADFRTIAHLTPREFVSDVLIGELGCKVAVAGFNYRFGKGAAGTSETLAALMRELGEESLICEPLTYGGETVSASLIRKCIEDGDVGYAKELLGAPYRISGRVEHGLGLGHTLGFPTLNTEMQKGTLIPRAGVYKTAVTVGESVYLALTNVGSCPTFGDREIHAESFILDFSGDLYGEVCDIYFLSYIRDERRFDSPEELIMQINVDINAIKSEGGNITWQELGLK